MQANTFIPTRYYKYRIEWNITIVIVHSLYHTAYANLLLYFVLFISLKNIY